MKKLTCVLLCFALFPSTAFSAYKRNQLEQQLVDWSNTRIQNASGPGTMLWQLVQMKDFWKGIRNANGTVNQYTALNGLIRVRSAVDYYQKQGDLELARAVVHASNNQRLESLATDESKTSPKYRYNHTRQRIKDYQPYLEPLLLKSPDLFLEASMQFKGYAIDSHLAWYAKRRKLSPAQRTLADKIATLQNQQNSYYKTLLLKPKKGAEANLAKVQASAKVKFDQVTKELQKYTPEQIRMSNTWVNLSVIPSPNELRSLIDPETLVIDIVQARSLSDKPYSINAWDRKNLCRCCL
ncbi:MAG: hypothetical protein ACON5N_10485 [Akkermansiaceae bacterium]